MYKFERYRQLGLADLNQPAGLKMNPENRWVKKAETIPWDAIEEKYAQLFPGKIGMPTKPLRTAPGSLLIQKQGNWWNRSRKIRITSILSGSQVFPIKPLCPFAVSWVQEAP